MPTSWPGVAMVVGIDERLEPGELDLGEAQGDLGGRMSCEPAAATAPDACAGCSAARPVLGKARNYSRIALRAGRIAYAARDGDAARRVRPKPDRPSPSTERRRPASRPPRPRGTRPRRLPAQAAAPVPRAGSGRRRRGNADETRIRPADRADSAPRPPPPCAPCPSSRDRARRRAASACTDAAARANSALRRRELDDAAEVHHADAIGDVVDHREVVRDEEIGEAHPLLQVAHQVQHLRLHRHVERGRRLVADEEPRLRSTARGRSRCAAAARRRTGADTSRRRRRASPTCASSAADARAISASRSSPAPAPRIGSATMSATRQRGLRLA